MPGSRSTACASLAWQIPYRSSHSWFGADVPANSPSLADIVTVNADVVFKELSGEGVLLDLASGMYFGLDETSTRLWQLINERGLLQRVFDDMLAEFDVEPDRLQQDLLNFVAELTRRNLVSLAGLPSSS